jgi:hypothetical protein
LLCAQIASGADTAQRSLARAGILESNVAYLQVSRMGKNLPDEIRAAQDKLTVSNKIAGTVLDLRFANGDDLTASQAVEELLSAGKLPLMILVNRQTGGAAASLAVELREARAGLIFGSVADTAKTNSEAFAQVQPDIAVAIGQENERAYLKNPFITPAQTETNTMDSTNNLLPALDYTSEADLVREKIKDGAKEEYVPAGPKIDPQMPLIQDPVLARAVDLIKGLAVFHASHS